MSTEGRPRVAHDGRDDELWPEEDGAVLLAMPHVLLRRGAGVVLVTLLLLLGVGWMVRFPDAVRARFVLLGSSPASPVVAASSGRLVLEVEEGSRVVAGMRVGSVGGGEDADAVLALDRALATGRGVGVRLPEPSTVSRLGTLEPSYAALREAVRRYGSVVDPDARARRRGRLVADLRSAEALLERQEAVVRTLAEELELAEELHARQALATELGAGAPVREIERAQVVAQARRALQLGELEVERLRRRRAEVDRALLELDATFRTEEEEARGAVRAARAELAAAIEAWRERALLQAPASGRVTLFDYRATGMFVPEGDTVLAVVPDTPSGPRARVELPASTVGRITAGQEVRLHFDAFPGLTYGVVPGRVSSISAAPRGDVYFVDIALPRGLETDTGRELPFREGPVGEAEIVTRDRSLLGRLMPFGG